MAKHTNKVIPSFLVTHYYKTGDTLYLMGDVLYGQQKGLYFSVEYYEISKEEYINSDNTEYEINFNYDGKYYCLSVGLSKDTDLFSEDIQNNLIPLKDNMPNGEFRYGKYMNCVAYIIMTGMIIIGI